MARAMNALSAASSTAPATTARVASTMASSKTSSFPCFASSIKLSNVSRNSVWPASHLLNRSESLAIRKIRSSFSRSVERRTGAEKSRRIEGVGFSGTSSNTYVAEASEKRSVFVVVTSSVLSSPRRRSGTSVPSGPTKPIEMGIKTGFLSDWPGVSGVACVSETENVRASASYAVVAVTSGVPACEYHGLNWERSAWLASAMAFKKSSHVTAWPSWRSKYRSIPSRKPRFPRSVSYMRTTSAPFSYTVTV